MPKITFPTVALVLLAGLAPAAAAAAAEAPPAIVVSGQGTVDRAPDRVTVTFRLITNDDSATRATSANNTAYNALTAKLSALGVGAAALKTTSYDLSYNPRPAQANPQFAQRYGYVVSRSVSLSEDRTDRVGALIDAAVAAGVSNVDSVGFGLRDERGAYRAALAAAVADARTQAEALAGAAHVRLGRILAIAPAGGYTPGPRPYALGRSAAMAAPVPTDVQPSDLSVRAGVSISYEIVP